MSEDSERPTQEDTAAQEDDGAPRDVSIGDAETDAVVTAIRSGDESAFAALAERHRWQLRVHCYRMLGSVDDAEDLVQDTFLRAWRGRQQFEGRSLFRTWSEDGGSVNLLPFTGANRKTIAESATCSASSRRR